MKKFFAFAAAAMMMFSASANSLSLYDYEIESYFVPFNSMWYDAVGNQTQVLYPAADLTEMVGQEIKAITFYTDEDGIKMNGGKMEVYMGETEETVMTEYIQNLTLVATITMEANGATEFTVTFDTPYMYQGGNLVFGTCVKEGGNWTMTYFGGEATNYNNCIYVGNYNGALEYKQFLPKTTFTYGDDTPQPQYIRGDVDGNGEVKIADVSVLINYLLGGDPTGVDLLAADCDENGEVKIAEVTALISYLLSNNW